MRVDVQEHIFHEMENLLGVQTELMIYGDDEMIHEKTDFLQILQILKKDKDHVMNDIMYLVDENGINSL